MDLEKAEEELEAASSRYFLSQKEEGISSTLHRLWKDVTTGNTHHHQTLRREFLEAPSKSEEEEKAEKVPTGREDRPWQEDVPNKKKLRNRGRLKNSTLQIL